MLTEKQVEEILQALNQLPSEKVEEARDFILFLQSQYGQQMIDESDAWTDEDLRDFTAASLSSQSASNRDGG
ncbi:MAG: hypothetical protein AUG51_02505 [Acidobacteria bacterium 13_1_20CM_3_53_8]|nr:MAG: hypothetical protein AUG51_02505 [Acidobacteria bacterium 13_1_20CM_3_53_8]